MLHEFRLLILLIFIVIKLSSHLISAGSSSSSSSSSWSSSPKKSLNWKKEKAKDHNFHCELELMPIQQKMMYSPSFDSALDDATSSHDAPKIRVPRDSFDVFYWPKTRDGFVVVPYSIPRGSKFSSNNLNMIRNAMDGIEEETCIRFRPREDETDYLSIYHGKFCKSNLGRTGGAQPLLLNKKDCFEDGIIMHELLHALGYIHTHSRPDRDKFVKVLWKNIDPKFRREFNQVSPALYNNYGTTYDYFSVMHYGPKAFTRNGEMTIATKDTSFQYAIGQRRGLSEGDVQRINKKYKCKESTWRLRLLSKWRDNIHF